MSKFIEYLKPKWKKFKRITIRAIKDIGLIFKLSGQKIWSIVKPQLIIIKNKIKERIKEWWKDVKDDIILKEVAMLENLATKFWDRSDKLMKKYFPIPEVENIIEEETIEEETNEDTSNVE